MTEIETTTMSAERKRSGELFNLIPIPFDLSTDECRYTNPAYKINVPFEARFIRDELLIDGARRVAYSGVILIDGQLRQRLEEVAGQRLSKTKIEILECSCYDLIVEFLRANYTRLKTVELQPHIYVTSSSALRSFSSSAEVDPSAITISHAVQIR